MLKELLELIAKISKEDYKPGKLELDEIYVKLSERVRELKYGEAKGMQEKLDELFSKGNQEEIKVFLILLINIIVELTIVIFDIDIDVDIDTEIETEIVVKNEAELNADVDVDLDTKIDAEIEVKTEIRDNITEIKDNKAEVKHNKAEVKDNKAIIIEDVEIKGNKYTSVEKSEIYVDKSKTSNIVYNYFNFGNIGDKNTMK